jgi:hypothetical protein
MQMGFLYVCLFSFFEVVTLFPFIQFVLVWLFLPFFLSFFADFMQKSVRRDKEDHHIIIKGKTQQEDTTILNIYA